MKSPIRSLLSGFLVIALVAISFPVSAKPISPSGVFIDDPWPMCTGTYDQSNGQLYRYYNSQITDHYYTMNWSELGNGANGYVYEGTVGPISKCFRANETYPLYKYYNSARTDHFYTVNWNELGSGAKGYVYQGVAGFTYISSNYVDGTAQCGRNLIYRYWNATKLDHFYTSNWNELKKGGNGWVYEGTVGYIHYGVCID